MEGIKCEPIVRPFTCGPSGSTTFTELKIAEELEDLIESQTINDNELAIEGFFKVWLFHDSNFELQKIHICSGNMSDSTGQQLIIKCDIREAILDVNLMPVMRRDEADGFRSQTIPPSILSINNRNKVLNVLKIVGLVKRDGLCDSVVFGIPYVLSPTLCHDLSFIELQLNVQHFYALIEVMNEKNAVLILEFKQDLSPIYYFVLFSSTNTKTLIMKSLATKELVLPFFTDSVEKLMSNNPTQQIVSSVRQQLTQFSISDIYNPLYISNNLFDL